MKSTVLDLRKDGDTTCYLCKATLEEYVASLPPEYKDYDIQREIVKNVYLDQLVDTVLGRAHIPPIVLVGEIDKKVKAGEPLALKKFKILDGLQRTFRLQAIRNVVIYAVETLKLDNDLLKLSRFKFSRDYSQAMANLNATTEILRRVLHYGVKHGKDKLLGAFRDNDQWFEIWVGLTPDMEVTKMLTLNAGHKPVNTRHQMELLFLHLLPVLREQIKLKKFKFELVREKDIRSAQFSKRREPGQIHFSHLIAALLSIHHARPEVATAGLIQTIQAAEVGIEEYNEITTVESLRGVVEFLLRLDQLATAEFKDAGIRWMGREVTLAGLFGALGRYASEHKTAIAQSMDSLVDLVKAKPSLLQLDEFETVRNSLDLSKVNFGTVNRNAVYQAIFDLLNSKNPKNIDWKHYFQVSD